ncbi:protein DEHYDRATION-INDUCED 19 homolog 4-like [Sesamum indicum]|uniref:Protein DEHYDRATION-INDUCED 19 homolog 4-like n=1 Tax=Sesamum indicum TaxID=4182 RepID=A0A8M8UVC8_SESIN|nr:protein DEHYDRATION-INDUCED 19 homolog 4-like [Sesamum indicum]
MDPRSWARMYSSARRYQSRSDVYRGDEFEEDEETRPEFLCPFCAEDFDMVGLCCHIDEEHAAEAKNGVCPVCSERVGSDLVRHVTLQHANLLKVPRRRRFRRGGPDLSSMLRRELQEGKLQSLLSGSSLSVPSSHAEPDPLLNSFIYNPSLVDEPLNVKHVSSIEACSVAGSAVESVADRAGQERKLSEEEQKEKAQRCEFVQGLLLSTFLDDNL